MRTKNSTITPIMANNKLSRYNPNPIIIAGINKEIDTIVS